MAGFKDRMGKLKNWMIIDDDNTEEYEAYDDGYDEYDEYDDGYDDYDESLDSSYSSVSAISISEYHGHNQMKVVIVEPKLYDDAAVIADHLKMKKTVIVNLEKMTQSETKKSIFNFMNGAVYVLDGNIQRVNKSIFILAPKNVDVDSNMKTELESKATFPWQK